MQKKQNKCPTCNIALAEEKTASWPFCSNRCRMIDLGKWMNEDYRVPAGPSPVTNSDDQEDQ